MKSFFSRLFIPNRFTFCTYLMEYNKMYSTEIKSERKRKYLIKTNRKWNYFTEAWTLWIWKNFQQRNIVCDSLFVSNFVAFIELFFSVMHWSFFWWCRRTKQKKKLKKKMCFILGRKKPNENGENAMRANTKNFFSQSNNKWNAISRVLSA